MEKIIKLRKRNNHLNEGIDFNEADLTVSYNPSHENNIETSEYTNPTLSTKYVPFVEVWSIFKRKSGSKSDGNPLVFAMKNERGWHFKSENDKILIYKQIYKIAKKFFSKYKSDVTIVLPSNGILNKDIANLANKMNSDALFINDLLIKMTTDEVRDMILLPNSLFRKTYNTRRSFETALSKFDNYVDHMENDIFRVHYIKDPQLRTTIEQTIRIEWNAVAKYFDAINDKDILLLDDNIGYGTSIINTCDEILTYYSPKSITVLTLFSEKYDEDGKEITRN